MITGKSGRENGAQGYQHLQCSTASPCNDAVWNCLRHRLGPGTSFLYDSLNNNPTPDTSYNVIGSFSISGQQIDVSAGTVLAFFIKLCLGFAVSTTFAKVAWRAINFKSAKVGTLDGLFGLFGNTSIASV